MHGSPDQLPQVTDSEALLRLIFDHAGEGICVFDADWRLRSWNPLFLVLTRLDPALARVGAALEDLVMALAVAGEYGPGEPLAETQRRLRLLRQQPRAVTEYLRPDGRTIEMRRNPTPDGGFVSLYTDITERKAEQAALAEQKRMLELLIQNTEQGIWFIDNGLRTTNANPAMCRLLGLPLAQMLGRTIFEFVDEANADIFRQRVQRRSQGAAESYEIALRHAEGHAVHCYNNATPIFDAAGQKIGAVGMFSDISPLKDAERQVRLSSELLAQKSRVLEATLDALSQGVLSIDADGRTHAWNRTFLNLMQIPESLMQARPTIMDLGRHQIQHGHFEGVEFRPELDAWRTDPPRYQRARSDGVVLEVQTHRGADGSVVRTYTDVTAAVQSQQALQESESRFRSMADAAPAFIWLSDARGAAIWFNQRWLQTTGRAMEAELALSWGHRMHGDDLELGRSTFESAAARQLPYQLEYRMCCRDGSLRWLLDHGIPRFTPDGRFEGFIVYGWDTTERKAAEAGLRAAKNEAERANRAKSEFLSRMSHELRTPLNAVLGFAQLLDADTADPLSPPQRARVQELQRGGRHLLSLINDVLDLARIEAGRLSLQLAAVDVDAVASDCLRLVSSMAAVRQVSMHLQGGAAGQVLADPTRLKQVLLNLLSNAIKYNRPGGEVHLGWQRLPGMLRIEVRDTGPGLSPTQQARLFLPFERLDAEHSGVEGAGIGLALSKWLVDLMQGHIGVDSIAGVGSVFWLSLTDADADAQAQAQAQAQASAQSELAHAAGAATAPAPLPASLEALAAAPAQKHDVLYIEDNEVNRLLMEGMLAQRSDIQLRMAAMPLEGLQMAAQRRADLVLLDIQLPDFDGFEVLRRLRQQEAQNGWPPVPVVAVSANAMPADREKAVRAGFADYITKPIDLPLLLATVDRLLAR